MVRKILTPIIIFFLGYLIYSRWEDIIQFGNDPFTFLIFSFILLLLAWGIYRILQY